MPQRVTRVSFARPTRYRWRVKIAVVRLPQIASFEVASVPERTLNIAEWVRIAAASAPGRTSGS